MTDFDVIEFGYNSGDETINFGTRCLADGDNLYEASTLATLRCSEQTDVKSDPHLNAVIQNGLIYFSVDTSIRIFKDKQCSDVIFNVGFDAIIDTFCLSSEGDYLLICLRSGKVHLIDCNNEYNNIFSMLCERDSDGDRFYVNSFLDDGSFLIVTKAGQVYRIRFQSDIKMECVYEVNFRTEIASFQYPFLLVNGTRLATIDLENNNITSVDGYNFKKVFPLTHMFLALDSEGNLFRICAISMLIFPINNSVLYKDMQLLSDSHQKQVIVVTEDVEYFIQLLSYPDLTKMYSLKVKNEIHLISPESFSDELLYISKLFHEGSVSELRFHVVYETEPEQRLLRLLKKHQYEEAERFATLFHLDKGLINKAKAQEIVDKTTCNSEDIINLINLLNIIEDDEFRLQCCLGVESSCCFEDVRKILSYGCKLQLRKQENRSAAEDLQKSVTHLMYRFDTYMTINRGNDQAVQSWLQFATCHLVEEVTSLLRNYQIEEAKIIYSRLDELTTERLSDENISEILTVLNTLPISTYESFLPIFVPNSLSILPSTLPLFVKWTHGKVFYLEKRCKSDFPNNAIRFTENIIGLMRVGDVGDISFQRQCVLHRDSLVELSSLLSALKTLKILKDEYRISIPVTGYLSGPQNVIRLLLNTEMFPEDYDVFLKHFLCKYMIENHMEPNEILLDEITDLMKYEERYWVNVIGSILNCISSVRVKLEAVKNILNLATVPWSDSVRRIADDSLKYSHGLTSDIKRLIEDEPVQVVLRKPKYKIKERCISSVNDLKFVCKRIIYCNEQTMVEDVYKLCKSPENRHVANMLLITHFIRIGCFERAMEILDDNEPEEVLNSAQELAFMVETVVNNEMGLSDELTNNYYDVSASIFQRLNERSPGEFERRCNDKTLESIRNVRDLNKYFRIKTTTCQLRREKNKIVEGILDETRREFETGKQTIDGVFAVCHKLSASSASDNDEILMRFCERSGDYNVILKTAQRVYDAETSAKNLCLMAVLLIKYVGTYKTQLLDNSLSDSEASMVLAESPCLVDDDVFCKGLQYAEILIAKAMHQALPDEVCACMEVAKWVNTSFYFTRSRDDELKKTLFGDIFDSASILPGFLTFSTIQNVFNAFCGYIGAANNPNGVYLTHFNTATLTEEEFFRELKLLPSVLENLSKEGQNFTCCKIVDTLLSCLIQMPKLNPAILNFLNDVLKKRCIPKILSSILSNSMIDSDLLYDLLILCDREDSFKFIRNSLRMYKRHPRKFASITRTGLRYLKYQELSSGKTDMMNTLITLKWWKKFETKKLDYDNFFKIKALDRFEFLINNDCLDMKLAKEYCEDYNLDLEQSYKFFLKKIFQNWKPDFEIKTDANRRYLIVKNTENDLLYKCQEIMEALDKQQVVNIITNVWNSVNTYYYEVFIAMLNVLSQIQPHEDNSTKLAMLFFLKNYQRVSKPSESEIEQWYTIFPDTQSLDVLSEFRLSFTPFLFTKQIFFIIRPEINLNTYKLWFNAIDILKPYLNRNDICSYVVKDVVASGVLANDTTDDWVLYSKHDDLLKQIDDCVMNISDLELTTSVMYHLMTHTPHGADQVNAAKFCYKYAIQYRKLNPESGVVEKAVIKVEKKYFTYCAMHILYTHRLAEKKYINLVTQPNDLILALYLDERILKKSEIELECPDINKATAALADLFNLDIEKIRHGFVSNWLGDNASPSFDLDSSMIYSSEGCGDDDNLNRIAYVCCAGDVAYWRTHLVKMGLGQETEEQKSVHCQARALKVFVMISDVDSIVELTDCSYDEFMYFIDKLTLVSNLQYLGIGLDVQALDQYSKKELLNRLVQRAGNILAIKTMALICTTYKIYDVKYWEFIVNSTIKFSLYNELKVYVNFLNKVKYHYKNFYINAWQKLIDYSFSHLSNSKQLDQVLFDNFLTIQSCPVLYCLNFDNAFRKCMDRDKPEFAAVLLQYFDGSKRDEYVKEIRNSNKDLVASLNNLNQKGLWGIFHVRSMLED